MTKSLRKPPRSLVRGALWFVSMGGAAVEADELPVPVVFMEPCTGAAGEDLPTYRAIDAPDRVARYRSWLQGEAARRGLLQYRLAFEVLQEVGETIEMTPYHVALVPGGNHAAKGFTRVDAGGTWRYPDLAYIKLDPAEEGFGMTLCHETGHVVLETIAGPAGLPVRRIASIPHATAALTDRTTAFNEGYAIHLETLAAHLARDADLRGFYHHETFDFQSGSRRTREFHRLAADLATFAQTGARYQDVRDNRFAFASAFQHAGYLRAQLDPGRDGARLRDANQLLQSEGFYASFFFAWSVRGTGLPDEKVVEAREGRVLRALREMFENEVIDEETPYLLLFIEHYMEAYAEEAGELLDVFLDLTRGVFVDPAAASLWQEHYLSALRLDLEVFQSGVLDQRRREWKEWILEDSQVLHDRLGPQLVCEVPGTSVKLVAFGGAAPLSFDLNTATEGVLRCIPEISEREVLAWRQALRERPFQTVADFQQRVPLAEATAARLHHAVR